jgi:hypothetical protein
MLLLLSSAMLAESARYAASTASSWFASLKIQTHREAAEVKHCAVKDGMGSSMSKHSLLNSKAENLFALEGNAAVLHGQDVGVAL